MERKNKKYYSYDGRNRNDGVDTLIDEFIRECEREAAKLEVTVDYYLMSLPNGYSLSHRRE